MGDHGTYRIVTTGDDCKLCFWSFERKNDQLPLNFHPSEVHREIKTQPSLHKLKPLFTFAIPGG